MSWLTKPARGHPLVTTVVLEPIDYSGDSHKLQLTNTSASVLKLPPGRYQLTTTAPVVVDRQAYGWNIELALFERVNRVRLSQENAVRLEIGDIIQPASMNGDTEKASAPASPAPVATGPRAQILALLDRWATSIQARNLRTLMSCYAPDLARYLQQQNVSWEQVEAAKRKLLEQYPQVRQMQLSDIDLTIDEGQAVGTAVKKWDLANRDVESRGAALVTFRFAQIDSQWVITAEWEQVIPAESRRKAGAGAVLESAIPN